MPSHARFEIDIVSALVDQLIAAFACLEVGRLDADSLSALEEEQGVYQLYQGPLLVYVGKADRVRSRLQQHLRKLSGRRNVILAEMGYRCLYVHRNWTALAPEESLIRHYRDSGEGVCAWNGNGFGPHDPGRERETTNKPPEGFDAQYPIIDDYPCHWITAGDWNIRDLLVQLKEGLPFLLRYECSPSYRRGHPDYNDVTISLPASGMAANEILRRIAQALPGWQATAFPHSAILYRERRAYQFGRVLWPQGE